MTEQTTKITAQSPSELMKRIEMIAEEFSYEIKLFRGKASSFIKSDKKLLALKAKADRKPSGRRAEKFQDFLSIYKEEYKDCISSKLALTKKLDEAEALYLAIFEYNTENGKKRDAKRISREAEKFDEPKRRKLAEIVELLNTAEFIELCNEKKPPEKAPETKQDTARQAQTETSDQQRPRQPQYPPYGMPYPPYGMPMYAPPVSVDVNAAADYVLDGFVNRFEAKMSDYLESFKLESLDAYAGKLNDNSARVAELSAKIAENEGVALEKLIATSEKIAVLFESLTKITEALAGFEEKMHHSLEAMRTVNELQRALSRELQGIGAKQKIINSDQSKVAEEQLVVYEMQKANLAHQNEISEAQKSLADDFALLEQTQKAINAAMQEATNRHNALIEEQEAILRANEKSQEMQKSLTEKQARLSEMQKEALSAQKKLERSQKGVNVKFSGGVKKSAPKAESKQEEALKEASEELTEEKLEAEMLTEAPELKAEPPLSAPVEEVDEKASIPEELELEALSADGSV